jgi:hypothetical protein
MRATRLVTLAIVGIVLSSCAPSQVVLNVVNQTGLDLIVRFTTTTDTVTAELRSFDHGNLALSPTGLHGLVEIMDPATCDVLSAAEVDTPHSTIGNVTVDSEGIALSMGVDRDLLRTGRFLPLSTQCPSEAD